MESAEPAPDIDLRCFCGARVPADLPPPGAGPVPCADCGTPLERPGSLAPSRANRATVGAVIVGVACAIAWALLSSSTGSGLPFVVAVAGGLVGVAARAASRSRGSAVQAAALGGFVVFVLLGEMLLFQLALHPRLVAMHAREGAAEPAELAAREIDRMRRLPLEKRLEHYVLIEATLGLFVALGVGGALALLVTRAPPAVAALCPPRPVGLWSAQDSGVAPPAEEEPELDTAFEDVVMLSAPASSDPPDAVPELPEITSDPMDVSDFVHPVEAEEPTYDLADPDEIARREAAARGDEDVFPPEDPR